jgi:CspA family cold shock protein
MKVGFVKWFNDSKGFGFLTLDGYGKDIFCHYTAVMCDGFKTLREGERVEFELIEGPKGPQAANIRPLDRGQA